MIDCFSLKKILYVPIQILISPSILPIVKTLCQSFGQSSSQSFSQSFSQLLTIYLSFLIMDLTLFSQPSTIPQHLLCAVCHKVMVAPHSLNCEHSLCLSCYSHLIDNDITDCMLCSTEITSVEPDSNIDKQIQKLKVLCIFNAGGCSDIIRMDKVCG